jgi:acetyl esterase
LRRKDDSAERKPLVYLLAALAVAGLLFASWQARGYVTSKLGFVPDATLRYGTHPRQTLDLYLSSPPGRVVVYFHGGGFGFDEEIPPAFVRACRTRGLSVASVDYRLYSDAIFSAAFDDCRDAVTFLRNHAGEYHLDPAHISTAGTSAGGGLALWLGFRGEFSGIACEAGQCSYDPGWIKDHIGQEAARHHFRRMYGLGPGEDDSDKARAMYRAASPITFASADSPPVWLHYSEVGGSGIHSPKFGEVLKSTLDGFGVSCELRLGGKPDYEGMAEFLAR